jgi:glucose/mannose-6-phosphate isomerase
MNELEPPYGERDALDMAGRIDGVPEQIEQALGAPSPWQPPARAPSLLAVGAMGGSAIAGDLVAALYADQLPRPVVVVRDYRWPAFVTGDAFALLCSYSGNTEETLALYHEARRRGVARGALTTGGGLAEACAADGVPWASLPPGSPPRAALFASWVPLTRLLHSFGWCDDPLPAWRETAAGLRDLVARIGTSVPESRNSAKQLARALLGRLPFVYAGSGVMAPVAARFRHQLHENAKLPGHSATVPELNHNEIVGWERPGAVHHAVAVLVLRDPEDHPDVATRLDLTAEYVRRQGATVHVLAPPQSGGRLVRMAAQILFGDYVSLYLALALGVDPTPIASIDEFKRRLKEGRSAT